MEEIESPKELTSIQKLSTFLLINLALFVSYALYTLPVAFLPVYNLARGINTTATGLIVACVPLCYIIVCPIAGKLLDRFNTKKMLLLTTGILALVTYASSALGLIASNTLFITLLVLLRLIQGATGGMIDVICFAMTAKIYPNNIALTTSIVETSLNLAVAVTPFLGGVFYEAGGFYLSFTVTASAVLLLLLASLCGISDVDCKKDEAGGNISQLLREVMVWFPAWHSAACMILFNFYIPILAPYVKAAFNAGPAFAGFALLINTAGICITAPILGHAMDKLNPYLFFASSAFLLPLCYWFLGPAPFLAGIVHASKLQLVIVLGLIGVLVPLGCYPGLLIMFDVYEVKYNKMPQSVRNYITAMYCASFPLGGCIGSALSGVVTEEHDFAFGTTYVSFAYLAETLLVIMWCVGMYRLKYRRGREQDGCTETTPIIFDSLI